MWSPQVRAFAMWPSYVCVARWPRSPGPVPMISLATVPAAALPGGAAACRLPLLPQARGLQAGRYLRDLRWDVKSAGTGGTAVGVDRPIRRSDNLDKLDESAGYASKVPLRYGHGQAAGRNAGSSRCHATAGGARQI
jgi:hypothetical protein